MNYKIVQQKIEKEETVIYQASAKCENYKLALDLYQRYRITLDFFKSVDLAMSNNDWSSFILQYGTHYTTEVQFGGRVILEAEFTRNLVAGLKLKGIDIRLAIKDGLVGYYGQASANSSLSEQQAKQVASLTRQLNNYYIGGVPPGKGNIQDWQIQVNKQPMPISYKLMPLSDLFAASPGKSAAWAQSARDLFQKGLNAYCLGKCTTPTPDRPLPTNHSTTYAFTSSLFGGDGGNVFQWNQMVADWHISKVKIRSGAEIDGIQVYASHKDTPNTVIQSGYYGGSGGEQKIFSVQPGDWINKIEVRSGSRVDGLIFYTKNNPTPTKFGGNGGVSSIVTPPRENYKWTGIVGKSGARLDKIGFLFTLTVWDIGHAHHITKVVYPEEQQ